MLSTHCENEPLTYSYLLPLARQTSGLGGSLITTAKYWRVDHRNSKEKIRLPDMKVIMLC